MTPVAQRKGRETRWQARGAAHSQHVCALSPSAVDEDAEEDGHTVVATARGVFSSNGGVLSSIETGVSIIIPQGAIPDGVEQEIYFKVCRDNSILPPLDKEKGSRPRCPARLPPSTLPPSAVGVARAAQTLPTVRVPSGATARPWQAVTTGGSSTCLPGCASCPRHTCPRVSHPPSLERGQVAPAESGFTLRLSLDKASSFSQGSCRLLRTPDPVLAATQQGE